MGAHRLELAEASPTQGPLCIGAWTGATVHIDEEGVLPVEVVLVPAASGRWELLSLRPGGHEVNGRRAVRREVATGDVVSVGTQRCELRLREAVRDGTESPLLVTLRWGVTRLDERVVAPGAPVTLGPRGTCLLATLDETRAIARLVDGRWCVAHEGPWRVVDVSSGSEVLPDEDIGGWSALSGQGARLELGGLSVTLARTVALALPRLESAPWWSSVDGQRTIISLFCAVFLLAVLRNPPVGSFAPDEAAQAVRDLVAQYRPAPRPQPEVKLERVRLSQADEREEAGVAKAEGREGVSGRADAVRSEARRAGPGTDAERVREHALLKALSSGVAERLLSGGTLSAASALGRLDGAAVGDSAGTLGLGLRGDGRGGGGLSTSSMGITAIGTGKGLAKAAGAGRIGRGTASDLGLDEAPDVAGGLDREVIRRVVVSHRAQVRYCYEKQLMASPGIAGKLLVEFVIGADGHVVSARPSEDGVGDAEVGRCIVSRVRGWTFPPPKGGGVVVVTYPFLFKPMAQGGE
jgi:TonB family protein